METPRRPRIVILGAGFAGMYAARTLARLLPRDEDAEIVLVDQNNFMLFTPMLTEVASGELDTRHIVNPVRRFSRRIRFEQGQVDGIDVAAKRVELTFKRPDGLVDRRALEADHLVLALGSVPNFHHIEGMQEHALTMKSLGDAMALRNRVIQALERADVVDDPELRRQLLTFVVGGGGFSGVETMAAVNDFARDITRYYPHVQPDEIRTVIVEPGPRLLPELSAELAAYAKRKLTQRGVEVRLETRVSSATDAYVGLEGGERISTRTLIWTAGVTPSPVIAALDLPKGPHGAVAVDATCAVAGHPGWWALGDCAAVPMSSGAQARQGKYYGPTAQNATREGTLVAHNIVASERGEPLKPFNYTPIGELAIIGRRTGVASVYGRRFSGFTAWAMWRGVYLFKLPQFSKKVRVGLDWLLDLAFGRDTSELPTWGAQAVATGADGDRQAGGPDRAADDGPAAAQSAAAGAKGDPS